MDGSCCSAFMIRFMIESTIDRGKEPKAGVYPRASSKDEQSIYPKSVLAHRIARAMKADNGDMLSASAKR
jgi:hypothetical protein